MGQKGHGTEGERAGGNKGQGTGSEESQGMGRKPQQTKDGVSMGTGSWTGTGDWRALGRKGRRAMIEGVGHSSSQRVGVEAEGSMGVEHKGQGRSQGGRYPSG